MGKKSQKPKIVLPPELPPEILEEEIEVSDDDLQFVKENRDYAVGFSRLDTQSITKSVLSIIYFFPLASSIDAEPCAFHCNNVFYVLNKILLFNRERANLNARNKFWL